MMFQDEGRFGRISTPRRCWAPSGMRPDLPSRIIREYTYAFAALSPHNGAMDSLVLPQVNAQTMSLFLREVGRRHPDEFILTVMDGAGWHKSVELEVPENMHLVFLPPYSPQLNPVEHIWESIRENWFRNEVFRSMDGVENRLVQALRALENDPEKVASLSGFPWIISSNLTTT
ncbi:MAG: IS630 family transposase [Syntrophobacteraceae bacterium]